MSPPSGASTNPTPRRPRCPPPHGMSMRTPKPRRWLWPAGSVDVCVMMASRSRCPPGGLGDAGCRAGQLGEQPLPALGARDQEAVGLLADVTAGQRVELLPDQVGDRDPAIGPVHVGRHYPDPWVRP